MPRLNEVLERQLQDPAMQEYWERTALARAVANAVIQYRADHEVSQRGLATTLGWKPSQVARLEKGEHNPGMDTLTHLANRLGLRFVMEIGPGARRGRAWRGDSVEDITTVGGGHILVRAGSRRTSGLRPGGKAQPLQGLAAHRWMGRSVDSSLPRYDPRVGRDQFGAGC